MILLNKLRNKDTKAVKMKNDIDKLLNHKRCMKERKSTANNNCKCFYFLNNFKS